jgi:hypothetical protein
MGVPITATTSMLSTIQDMKFYLRIGYKDSKEFEHSSGGIKTQGLCQGNGAAPAGWTTTNITMFKAHKWKDHGAHLVNPISKGGLHVASSIFVDNTNLEQFGKRCTEMVEEAHAKFQESILNWGRLLIATVGALKSSKCFYHLISFKWNHNGNWTYKDNENQEEYRIVVLLEDGFLAEIEHLNVDTPTKTLGLTTAPSGSNAGAIKQMREKAEGWLAQAKTGKIHRRNFWFLIDKQFWPKWGMQSEQSWHPLRN